MRYLFLGKISACPDKNKIGTFAYHFADCDEVGFIDVENQRDSDFRYGVKDLASLRRFALDRTKNRGIDLLFFKNGIPQELKNKWIPDSDYILDRLSDEEMGQFEEKIIVKQTV